MRPDYKRGFAQVNDLMAAVWLILLAGCGGGDAPTPPSPAEPLEIVATVPLEGASDVPVEALISVTFSGKPDTALISGDILRIDGPSGEICCLGRTVTLRPTASLEYARTYTVQIDSGLTDCAGRHLDRDFVWKFRTIEDPCLPDFPDPPGKLPSGRAAGP